LVFTIEFMRAFIAIIFLTLTFTAFSQDLQADFIDARLQEFYSPSQLEHLKTNNPQLLARMNFYLDNAFLITDQSNEKASDIQNEVSIPDLSNFNILRLEKEQDLKRSMNKISVYKIKDTDKLLVFHSERNFNKEFLKYYERNFK